MKRPGWLWGEVCLYKTHRPKGMHTHAAYQDGITEGPQVVLSHAREKIWWMSMKVFVCVLFALMTNELEALGYCNLYVRCTCLPAWCLLLKVILIKFCCMRRDWESSGSTIDCLLLYWELPRYPGCHTLLQMCSERGSYSADKISFSHHPMPNSYKPTVLSLLTSIVTIESLRA